MNVLGRIATRLTHDDLAAGIVPFQNRPRTDAQLLADLGRNGDLTLCGELGMSESHVVRLPW
jgi:hypothetical protein